MQVMSAMQPAEKRRRTEDVSTGLVPRTYKTERVLGTGSFGIVFLATVVETGDVVAIKSLRQAPDKDREVQILKELEGHPNIVSIKGAFETTKSGKDKHGNTVQEQRFNLVLEYLSDTLHRVLKHHAKLGQKQIDPKLVSLYSYQLLRGLAFMHNRGLVHADIKPQNLLIDGNSQTLKICDFGTARRLAFGDKSMPPYVCSRYYRAPELALGCTSYTTSIDLWSAGCVYAELLLGQPLFTGQDGIDQFAEIVKVLGTPSAAELQAMNPYYPPYEFSPKVEATSWEQVFRGNATPEACSLAGHLLRFDPHTRLPPLHCLIHEAFDKLRQNTSMDSAHFTFLDDEVLLLTQAQREKLVPSWVPSGERLRCLGEY